LVVEDTAYTKKLLADVLTARGVPENRIFQASDGAAAIEILTRHVIDVVITDALMEPVDGIALTKAIRTSGSNINCDMPVILCTAHSEESRMTEARDAGVTEIVVKPFSVRTFYERISAAIERPRPRVQSAVFSGPDRRRQIISEIEEDRRKADYPLK
jgi:DNA-binding response OmpR family regulator